MPEPIIPRVGEEAWLASLREIRSWEPPPRRTIVIAPHPDDETLAAGGLIAAQRRRGVPVQVVALTNGEAAYGVDPCLGGLRRTEQERAISALGLDNSHIVRLNLPDSALASRELDLEDSLRPLISHDDLVVAPWTRDWHPDHEAAGRVAARVALAAGALLICWFFWSWHRHDLETLATLPLRRFFLDSDLQAARAFALAQHRSQLDHSGGPPILPQVLLSPARRDFETYLVHD